MEPQWTNIISDKDVSVIIKNQQHAARRFEETNEVLHEFNNLSEETLKDLQQSYKNHEQTLKCLKSDLNELFQRIRNLSGKLRSKYPHAFEVDFGPCIDDLFKQFTDLFTEVMIQPVTADNLEPFAKAYFIAFLVQSKNPLVNKNNLGSYFAEWRPCLHLQGPFDTFAKSEDALQEFLNGPDFVASMYIEQLLTNRADHLEAIRVFRNTMMSYNTKRLEVFSVGDSGPLNGVVVISEQMDGSCIFVNYLSE
eukprot:gene9470-10457_t